MYEDWLGWWREGFMDKVNILALSFCHPGPEHRRENWWRCRQSQPAYIERRLLDEAVRTLATRVVRVEGSRSP